MSDKAKETIDAVAGAGTADKLEGRLKEAKGTIKETGGEIMDNESMKHEGQAEQAEGKVQRTVGTLEAVTHGVIDAVADGAHKLGDAVKHLIHHDEKK